MPRPTEHKTVQARILHYTQEIGWTYVPRIEAERRRGFDPAGTTQEERARKASLYFGDLLHTQVRAFNSKYKEAEGALIGQFQRFHADIPREQWRNVYEVTEEFYTHNGKYGTREDVVFLINLYRGRRREGHRNGRGLIHFAAEELPPMSQWRDREEFKARVLEWAVKFDVKVHGLYVRPMRNKWASCSTSGTLSFNDELLGMERDLGDYVIVHELLHFAVPNHGKLWKSLMRAHLGEYERLEARMKHASKNSCLLDAGDDRQGRRKHWKRRSSFPVHQHDGEDT